MQVPILYSILLILLYEYVFRTGTGWFTRSSAIARGQYSMTVGLLNGKRVLLRTNSMMLHFFPKRKLASTYQRIIMDQCINYFGAFIVERPMTRGITNTATKYFHHTINRSSKIVCTFEVFIVIRNFKNRKLTSIVKIIKNSNLKLFPFIIIQVRILF